MNALPKSSTLNMGFPPCLELPKVLTQKSVSKFFNSKLRALLLALQVHTGHLNSFLINASPDREFKPVRFQLKGRERADA